MYTIMVDKTTHRARPNYPDTEEYGWALKDQVLQYVPANGHCDHKIYLRKFPAGPRKVVPETALMPNAQQDIQGHNTLMKNIKSQKIVYYT